MLPFNSSSLLLTTRLCLEFFIFMDRGITEPFCNISCVFSKSALEYSHSAYNGIIIVTYYIYIYIAGCTANNENWRSMVISLCAIYSNTHSQTMINLHRRFSMHAWMQSCSNPRKKTWCKFKCSVISFIYLEMNNLIHIFTLCT